MPHRNRHNRINLRTLAPYWKVPVPPGNTNVGVQSVADGDGIDSLDWTFTESVTSISADGLAGLTAAAAQLQASADGVTFYAPTAAAVVDGAVRATYPAGVAVAGSIYRISAAPAGITFAQGTCALPQVGTVITADAADALRQQTGMTVAGAPRRAATAKAVGKELRKPAVKKAQPARVAKRKADKSRAGKRVAGKRVAGKRVAGKRAAAGTAAEGSLRLIGGRLGSMAEFRRAA